ncbi:aminotransferase class III-fold pyridoxal phosphate-dependent enzyme [Flavilitoribacter nigricans]|uniref:Alanine--glyoxylate aminotransferase n=1 Tax=Flavilitoribacter nigricans (strain ATCC 23147 / DSM 23189 / NBRC 102662 / NCIMB 1420 / SS-2) TaxID=1122177 RepID=A0A2D0NIR8_FLAN2|nr:aminotransferase class III-fold pyridoxal phosphate-dependent enzyme [Flavilitoribacter nigricans]PHN08290.1 alanine--glyoxylate aminotransferase [Flavilitoribacter nigricans DSM 23189 = NBRC 102662]
MTTSYQITTADAQLWIEKHWSLAVRTIRPLPGEVDLNFYVETEDDKAFTFKVSRPQADEEAVDFQQEALQWLIQHTLPIELPYPIPNHQDQMLTLEQDEQGEERVLRMVQWVPGKVLAKTNPKSLDLLYQMGEASGALCKALQGFDHPAGHRFFKWDLARLPWISDHLDKIRDTDRRALVEYFIDAFHRKVAPVLPQLRTSIIHNDANDYNVLVRYVGSRPVINGVIDFGDAIHTQTVNDLAIAIAYGIMDKPNPLEAAAVMVAGFHASLPLEPEEVELLYYLIGGRLAVSVTNAAVNKDVEPENTYLLISERPAWELLQKWSAIPAALAHYTFRQTCGWEACPRAAIFREWAATYDEAPFVLDVDPVDNRITALDLRVGSSEFGNNESFNRIDRFDRTIQRMLEDAEADLGIGGYGEVRPFYTTDAYQVAGNNGPEWRTVHLGLDVWGEAGLPVVAPVAGKIHSIQDNQGDCDYGPTIILEHEVREDLTFYTLYGHLSADSLDGKQIGDAVQAGQVIAHIGNYPVNGNWPPHLHFQIMLDLLEWEGDFPGVAFPEQREVWMSICPDPALIQPRDLPVATTAADSGEIRRTRDVHLGKSLSISYDAPLHIVRGFGPYLYDVNGRRYLDTVNNVAHVGHEHPRVVRAGQRQMGILNTNTRYLHENITALAKELLATMPPELSVVHFVNSGSEANELALRMARTWRGHTDMIAVEVGYHGNTGAVIDVSSYKFDGRGGQGVPPNTQIVPIPDTYRGLYRGNDPQAGSKYAAHLDEVIDRIGQADRAVAGFICESILSCGGQIELPAGYLREAYRKVRAAGGLCIADEVQVGFGRVGSHFWGFELQGVVPDIVTMGKPMGNGHPLAAVVCRPEVAEAFANGMEYFNTFGGNPVSCAIGRAVLQVIREEGLQENALNTGAYLRQGLLELQNRYEIIGDVRGPGFFQGIELVRHRETLTPAAAETTYIANRMRQLGILMSTDGPLHNVLKIKPPICFGRREVDFLIDTLDQVLQEDYLTT